MDMLKITGIWHQAKGKSKQAIAVVTGDDQLYLSGKGEEMIGRFQAKAGTGRSALKTLLSRF